MSLDRTEAAGKTERDCEERGLLVRHVSGDAKAFPELITAFRAQVYSFLVRLGVEAEARDDLFQEIFLKVHNSASKYQATMPLRPWIFTIVANTARSHFRKVKVREVITGDEKIEERAEQGVQGNSHDLAEAREMVTWLEREITALPLSQREVVVLCLVQGFSQNEVAGVLEMPLNTVKTNLRRGKMSLVAALTERSNSVSREVMS